LWARWADRVARVASVRRRARAVGRRAQFGLQLAHPRLVLFRYPLLLSLVLLDEVLGDLFRIGELLAKLRFSRCSRPIRRIEKGFSFSDMRLERRVLSLLRL